MRELIKQPLAAMFIFCQIKQYKKEKMGMAGLAAFLLTKLPEDLINPSWAGDMLCR
jgi:hypothetical protein